MPSPLFAPTTAIGGDTSPDREVQEQQALLRALHVTVEHYFGGITRLFGSVSDPRQPTLITYPFPMVLATGVLMFLLRFGARRQIQHWLRHNTPSAATFEALFAVANCPHGDTLNNV